MTQSPNQEPSQYRTDRNDSGHPDNYRGDESVRSDILGGAAILVGLLLPEKW